MSRELTALEFLRKFMQDEKINQLYLVDHTPRMMEEYASIKCAKQREVCSTLYKKEAIEKDGTWYQGIKQKIMNAPLPE